MNGTFERNIDRRKFGFAETGLGPCRDGRQRLSIADRLAGDCVLLRLERLAHSVFGETRLHRSIRLFCPIG